MAKYNKNISALIIIVCIICIIIGIFLPKEKSQFKVTKAVKIERDTLPGYSIISRSPFKGERIAVIKLEGVISDAQGSSIFKDLTSSNYVNDLIKKATNDNSIKGILIRINSPGGTVAASQELYNSIKKARSKKPVVITMGDIAASGGYYIASAADTIFANPGTITGSIGVITSYLNFYELLTMIGIQGVVIKSGQYKDIGNPTRPLTEEERKILQALLDDTYNQFLKDVSKGRNMPFSEIAKIAKGLIYTGTQAKKIGLVDYLGDYQKALKFTQKLAKERFPELKRKYGKQEIPVEETWKETSILDMLIGAFSDSVKPKVFNEKFLKPFSYSRFQPLWLLE